MRGSSLWPLSSWCSSGSSGTCSGSKSKDRTVRQRHNCSLKIICSAAVSLPIERNSQTGTDHPGASTGQQAEHPFILSLAAEAFPVQLASVSREAGDSCVRGIFKMSGYQGKKNIPRITVSIAPVLDKYDIYPALVVWGVFFL